jgi:hypothetical protein
MVDAVQAAYIGLCTANQLLIVILVPLYLREMFTAQNHNLLRMRRPRLAITQSLSLSVLSILITIRFQASTLLCSTWLIVLHLSALLALICFCSRAILIFLRYRIQRNRQKYAPKVAAFAGQAEPSRSPLRTPLSGYDDPDMVLRSPWLLRPAGYTPVILIVLFALMYPVINLVIMNPELKTNRINDGDCGQALGGNVDKVVMNAIIVATIGFIISAASMIPVSRLDEHLWIRPELTLEYLHLLVPFVITILFSTVAQLSQFIDRTYSLYVICLPIMSHNWICLGEIVRRSRMGQRNPKSRFAACHCVSCFKSCFKRILRCCVKCFVDRREVPSSDRVSSKESRLPPNIPWGEVVVEFQRMLEDPEGAEIIEQFLEKELSVENLMFYVDAIEFYKTFDDLTPTERIQKAKTMCSLYISNDGRYCINIPGDLRTGILKALAPYNTNSTTAASAANILKDSAMALFQSLTVTRSGGESGGNTKGSAMSLFQSSNVIREDREVALQDAHTLTTGLTSMLPLEKVLFEDAKQEILELMVKDSFGRLRVTPEYIDWYYKNRETSARQSRVDDDRKG